MSPPPASGDSAPGPEMRTEALARTGGGRVDALDGLRAIAVVLVVGYHMAGALPNGYLGVDIFFVLSGYLITERLLAERAANGRIDLSAFYRRRLRRLLPALLVLCAVVAAAGAVSGRHTAAVEWGVLTTIAYVANIWQYAGHDTYLLQHTWTLALEEQFYLLWPLLLAALGPGRSVRWLGPPLIAVLAADAIWHEPAVLHSYVRAGGLALGAGLAWARAQPGVARRLRRPARTAGAGLLLLIGLAAAPWPIGAMLTGWPISVAAVLTVPVVLGLLGPGRLPRLLSTRLPVWVGRRSYGIYLWHFPILAVALAQAPASIPLMVRCSAAALASVGCAAASYALVEQPFLRRGGRLRSPMAVADAADGSPAA